MLNHSAGAAPSVLFFRAVNVGGHHRFQPARLAKELSQFDVVNIGAAGTFIIRNPVDELKLHNEILKRLPFLPEFILCPANDVLALTGIKTFQGRSFAKEAQPFATILMGPPNRFPELPLEMPAGDGWEVRLLAIAGRFVLSLKRPGKTYPNALVEKCFGVDATTRNWNTICAINRSLEG